MIIKGDAHEIDGLRGRANAIEIILDRIALMEVPDLVRYDLQSALITARSLRDVIMAADREIL